MNLNKRDFFTIPNILSYIRLILIPFYIYQYLTANCESDYYVAAIIILLSSITDFADGFIARKFNQISELGKVLDPIADKLTQAAIIFSLMSKINGMFLLVVIFLLKETSMALSGIYFLKRGLKLDGAMWFGKLSTAVFFITSFILILCPNLDIIYINILLIITSFFLLLSFVLYSYIFYKMYKETSKN